MCQIIIFYILNFFFFLFFRKILLTITMTLKAFFLFLLQKYFGIYLRPCFFLFPSQKEFDIFHVLLFKAFLCVFGNIFAIFTYRKKNYKKYFFIRSKNYMSYVNNVTYVNNESYVNNIFT